MSLFSFSKAMHKYGIVLLCLISSACGGGSGGGSSPTGIDSKPTTGFQVSVDKTALKFESEEGRILSPLVVLGSGTGTTPATIYTGSLDLGTSLQQVTTEVIGTQLKFTVYPKSNLPAGTYNGSLQLFACADEKCTQHFSGSPATIPYSIVITKGFSASPQSLITSGISGNAISRDFLVTLPPGQASFQVSSNVTWLTITNQTTSGFSIKTLPMPPGNYTALVSVSYPGRNLTIPITLTVTADSNTVTKIVPDVTTLNFNSIAGASATAAQRVNITLPSWTKESNAKINYTSTGTNWLNLTKVDELTYSISALPQDLVSGTYTAQLIIGADPFTSPISIPVNFVVGAASWNVTGKTSFIIDGESQANQLSSELSIDIPALPGQSWTASSNAAWLKLGNTSGLTGLNKLQVMIDIGELLKMENFTSLTADVTISSANGKIAPRKLVFLLSKSLPQVNFITPAVRLPNEASTAIVRGRGFDSIINLNNALLVTGLPARRIIRVNDTQLNVEFDAADQGETSLSLKNALNIPTEPVTIKVVPQRGFTYSAIATQGAKGSIHFDAERQAIFTSNKDLGSVMRFAALGNTWNISTANVPSIDSSAMSPDGKSIVTTSTDKKISLIDPASMQIQASYTLAGGIISGTTANSLPRLAVTNNGKAFFQGASGLVGLNYFDLTARKFGVLSTTGIQLNISGGPWFNVSGDGNRLVIVQSASTTPQPKMLYLDSSDEVLKQNPSGIEFWYEAAQSLHGERFIESTNKVWDRDFNLVGNVVLPSTAYIGRLPIFAPDGNRVYILSYHSSAISSTLGTITKPRVYVIDTSKRLVTTTTLPVLGYFDIDDYPTCTGVSIGCNTRPLGTITPDGKTLFFVGDKNLIIAPIPTLQGVTPPPPLQQASKPNMVPSTMTRHDLNR